MTETIVIVPYRPDHGHRDRLWAFLRDNYWAHQPFDIVLGEHLDGLFNRSKAINQAAQRNWDYAIIADSDTFVPARQLHQALLLARVHGKLTAAFDAVVELSQKGTENLLAGTTTLVGSFDTDRVRTREMETQSSMLVIPRKLWDDIGGFDERFQGWGGEDSAYWHAANIITGTQRVPGNAYHLWHPPAPGKQQGINYRRNYNLWRQYEQARTIDQIRAAQCSPSA